MRRQACHVDSLCDHSMPEETHPVRREAAASDPAKRPKKLNRVHSNACVKLLRLHDKVAALR
jgi:hypothetical protein